MSAAGASRYAATIVREHGGDVATVARLITAARAAEEWIVRVPIGNGEHLWVNVNPRY